MRSRFYLAIMFTLLTIVQLAAQCVPHHDIAAGRDSNNFLHALPGAQVRVCSSSGSGTPCTPLATIASNAACAVVSGSTVSADLNGNYSYWAMPGIYVEQVSAFGYTTIQRSIVIPSDVSAGIRWSGLIAPVVNLSLAMGANTSTWTWSAATGAGSLFKLRDSNNNTGTGYLLDLDTGTGSSLKPFRVGTAGVNTLDTLASGLMLAGDSRFAFVSVASPTKRMRFDLTGVTAGQTRVMTPPNANAILAGLNVAQSWTAEQKFLKTNNIIWLDQVTNCAPSGGANPCANGGQKINECVFELPTAGGTCDLRGVDGTAQLATTTVNFGNSASKAVTFLRDANTVFWFQVNDVTKDAMVLWPESSIITLGGPLNPVSGGGFNICGTGDPPPCSGVASQFKSGFHVFNTGGGLVAHTKIFGLATGADPGVTCTNGVELQAITDNTTYSNVVVGGYPCTNAAVYIHAPAASSGTFKLDNWTIDNRNDTNTMSLYIHGDAFMPAITLDNFVINGGTTDPLCTVKLDATNPFALVSTEFNNLYMELHRNGQNMICLTGDVENFHINGMTVANNAAGPPTGNDIIKISGTNTGTEIRRVRTAAPFTNMLEDTFHTFTTGGIPFLAEYSDGMLNAQFPGRNYFQSGISLGRIDVVSMLALISQPPDGSQIYCTDCGNVQDDAAVAGAVCVGAGHGAIAKRQSGHWDCN